jgi:hypothetical protein
MADTILQGVHTEPTKHGLHGIDEPPDRTEMVYGPRLVIPDVRRDEVIGPGKVDVEDPGAMDRAYRHRPGLQQRGLKGIEAIHVTGPFGVGNEPPRGGHTIPIGVSDGQLLELAVRHPHTLLHEMDEGEGIIQIKVNGDEPRPLFKQEREWRSIIEAAGMIDGGQGISMGPCNSERMERMLRPAESRMLEGGIGQRPTDRP